MTLKKGFRGMLAKESEGRSGFVWSWIKGTKNPSPAIAYCKKVAKVIHRIFPIVSAR